MENTEEFVIKLIEPFDRQLANVIGQNNKLYSSIIFWRIVSFTFAILLIIFIYNKYKSKNKT